MNTLVSGQARCKSYMQCTDSPDLGRGSWVAGHQVITGSAI